VWDGPTIVFLKKRTVGLIVTGPYARAFPIRTERRYLEARQLPLLARINSGTDTFFHVNRTLVIASTFRLLLLASVRYNSRGFSFTECESTNDLGTGQRFSNIDS